MRSFCFYRTSHIERDPTGLSSSLISITFSRKTCQVLVQVFHVQSTYGKNLYLRV